MLHIILVWSICVSIFNPDSVHQSCAQSTYWALQQNNCTIKLTELTVDKCWTIIGSTVLMVYGLRELEQGTCVCEFVSPIVRKVHHFLNVWDHVCLLVCACVLGGACTCMFLTRSFFQPAASCLIGVYIDWSSFSLFSLFYFGRPMQLKEID